MVRNLDTGEVIHITEVEERVCAGTQPHSLRPLARSSPRGSWLAWLVGMEAPVVDLELCLQPRRHVSMWASVEQL